MSSQLLGAGLLSLDTVIAQESFLRGWIQDQPLLSAIVAFAAYTLITALSIPGATVMTLATAWLFGFWPALMITSFGSTAGATLAFLSSRYVLRDWVQHRFAGRLSAIQNEMDRDGAYYLFTLRLIPAVPFFLINLLMGLTPLRARTFWWVSQLGMLPGTAAYVYAGSSAPSLQQLSQQGVSAVMQWPLVISLVLLGLLPLTLRKLMGNRPDHADKQVGAPKS